MLPVISSDDGLSRQIGILKGSDTYGVPPTYSCGEAMCDLSNFDVGAPYFGKSKLLWLIIITRFVTFSIVHILYWITHEYKPDLLE